MSCRPAAPLERRGFRLSLPINDLQFFGRYSRAACVGFRLLHVQRHIKMLNRFEKSSVHRRNPGLGFNLSALVCSSG